MIVSDFPNQIEMGTQTFLSSGREGQLLDKLLQRAGFYKTSVYLTGACHQTPPKDKLNQPDIEQWVNPRKTCPGVGWEKHFDHWLSPEILSGWAHLKEEINRVAPTLIITLGSLPLLLLTGCKGASKWRGSRLSPARLPGSLLPTIHPSVCLKSEELIPILELDLKRAKRIFTGEQRPRTYNFNAKPSFSQVLRFLDELLDAADTSPIQIPITGDLETRRGHIACFGIGISETEALCIPILQASGASPFYWTEEQESTIVQLLQPLFRHPNILWVGQNYLYDCQYFWRFWGFLPLNVFDTMIGQHSLHSNMRKGLDFISSIYAQDYIYWKDESKDWDFDLGEEQLWEYNCKDCCYTWEDYIEIVRAQQAMGNLSHHQFQQDLFFPVLRMMNRGSRIDMGQRGELKKQLMFAGDERQCLLDQMAGHPLNPRSSKQLIDFFYHDLGIPVIRALKSDALTTNSPAMAEIAMREPALKPLCQTIVELRSISVFLNTFVNAELDSDGRVRCSFSVAGPTTFRFSSSENAFGSGMNLQNIPKAEKAKIKSPTYVKLPNIRKLFIPDPGYTYFDMDLDRADLQVVVWEADDAELKTVLRDGLDLHCVNAVTIFDIKGVPIEHLKESHPNYKELRGKIGEAKRDKCKAGVHATNYGVFPRKLAATLGISIREAETFISAWFGAHPGIARWHKRTEESLATRGYIENRFGARIYKIGRLNLPEFYAWLPQSTVAGVINRALKRIDHACENGLSSIQLILQVHDSLGGQFLTARKDAELERLQQLAQIVIPYEDPLIIPVGIKTSSSSWGDCS